MAGINENAYRLLLMSFAPWVERLGNQLILTVAKSWQRLNVESSDLKNRVVEPILYDDTILPIVPFLATQAQGVTDKDAEELRVQRNRRIQVWQMPK